MRLCPSCLLQAGLVIEGPSNEKTNPRQVSARQTIDSGQVTPEKSPLYDRVYIKRHYIGQRADNEGDFRIIITEYFYQLESEKFLIRQRV